MAGFKLQRRERVVVVLGVVSLSIFALYLPAKNLWGKYGQSQTQLDKARDLLAQTRILRDIIETERSGRKAIEEKLKRRPANFDLWNFTNQSLRESKIEKFASLDRKRLGGDLVGVQMTLKGVRSAEFVDLLHRMYAADSLIVVQKLDHLRPARDEKGLDCQITFASPNSKRRASRKKS